MPASLARFCARARDNPALSPHSSIMGLGSRSGSSGWANFNKKRHVNQLAAKAYTEASAAAEKKDVQRHNAIVTAVNVLLDHAKPAPLDLNSSLILNAIS